MFSDPMIPAAAPTAAEPPFLAGNGAVDDALALVSEFGSEAALAAQLRAASARARDNAAHFCRWREVERLIGWMQTGGTCGLLH
jgi:hypothetical protein